MKMTTFERMKNLLIGHLFVEPINVAESASFIDDLGADSLDLVEIIMAVEEEFNITVDDDDAEGLLTVGDAVRHIDRLMAG